MPLLVVLPETCGVHGTVFPLFDVNFSRPSLIDAICCHLPIHKNSMTKSTEPTGPPGLTLTTFATAGRTLGITEEVIHVD